MAWNKKWDKPVFFIIIIIVIIIVVYFLIIPKPKRNIKIQAITSTEEKEILELIQKDEKIIEYLYGPMEYVNNPLFAKLWIRKNGKLQVWYIIPAYNVDIEEIWE